MGVTKWPLNQQLWSTDVFCLPWSMFYKNVHWVEGSSFSVSPQGPPLWLVTTYSCSFTWPNWNLKTFGSAWWFWFRFQKSTLLKRKANPEFFLFCVIFLPLVSVNCLSLWAMSDTFYTGQFLGYHKWELLFSSFSCDLIWILLVHLIIYLSSCGKHFYFIIFVYTWFPLKKTTTTLRQLIVQDN